MISLFIFFFYQNKSKIEKFTYRKDIINSFVETEKKMQRNSKMKN